MKARAAVVDGPRRTTHIDIELAEPQDTEVCVSIAGSGVCGSNVPVWEGRPWFDYPLAPGAPGHEAWGIVEMVGAGVTAVRPGDHVSFLSDNAFATAAVVPASHVVSIPASLTGCPFPGEALGCGFNVVRRSGISAGQTVAVVGIGFLGAVVVAAARRAGARVIAASRREDALEVATAFGAEAVVRCGERWEVVEAVMELTDGGGCDVVIEAAGAQEPLDLATDVTREEGTLAIAGYHQDGLRTVNLQTWGWRALTVVNAHERDAAVRCRGIELAAEAIADGAFDPDLLYTHRFSLGDLDQALDAQVEKPSGFLKGLVIT
jgi:threonine dehydrogenase-like Zn-dependent dehydrogenase